MELIVNYSLSTTYEERNRYVKHELRIPGCSGCGPTPLIGKDAFLALLVYVVRVLGAK
jgi:hypothetical protein